MKNAAVLGKIIAAQGTLANSLDEQLRELATTLRTVVNKLDGPDSVQARGVIACDELPQVTSNFALRNLQNTRDALAVVDELLLELQGEKPIRRIGVLNVIKYDHDQYKVDAVRHSRADPVVPDRLLGIPALVFGALKAAGASLEFEQFPHAATLIVTG